MDLDQVFIDEFGALSMDIQASDLQGRIQMFFRLIKQRVTLEELAETFGVKNQDIDAALENFRVLGVVEETEEDGQPVFIFKGYPGEMKEIVDLFPERKKRLETSVKTLEQQVEKAQKEGQNVDKYVAVLKDVKKDFGIS
jgi:DNA-binding transcriptional regulator GbsR (MarR family)